MSFSISADVYRLCWKLWQSNRNLVTLDKKDTHYGSFDWWDSSKSEYTYCFGLVPTQKIEIFAHNRLPSLPLSLFLYFFFSENQRVWTLNASASHVGTSPESSQIPVTSERLISGTWFVNSPVSSTFFCRSGSISLWRQPVVVSLCWKRQCETTSKKWSQQTEILF